MFRSVQKLRVSWHHRQLDDAELPDRRRVVLKRLWGGSRHLDAARAPESGPSADQDPSPSSYSELLTTLRELRATVTRTTISESWAAFFSAMIVAAGAGLRQV